MLFTDLNTYCISQVKYSAAMEPPSLAACLNYLIFDEEIKVAVVGKTMCSYINFHHELSLLNLGGHTEKIMLAEGHNTHFFLIFSLRN